MVRWLILGCGIKSRRGRSQAEPPEHILYQVHTHVSDSL